MSGDIEMHFKDNHYNMYYNQDETMNNQQNLRDGIEERKRANAKMSFMTKACRCLGLGKFRIWEL